MYTWILVSEGLKYRLCLAVAEVGSEHKVLLTQESPNQGFMTACQQPNAETGRVCARANILRDTKD
jgi:hypothetical protein